MGDLLLVLLIVFLFVTACGSKPFVISINDKKFVFKIGSEDKDKK